MSKSKVWISADGGKTYEQVTDGVQMKIDGVPFDLRRAIMSGDVYMRHTDQGLAFDLQGWQGPGKVEIGPGGVDHLAIWAAGTIAPDIH